MASQIKMKDSQEYSRFLEVYKLKRGSESLQLFRKYITAVATNKRKAAVEAPVEQTMESFSRPSQGHQQGKAENTMYGDAANSYLETPFGAAKQLERAEFWATSVSLGYGSGGSTHQARHYSAYYARSFIETPLSVKGRVKDEYALQDFAEYIRTAQLQMTMNRGLMRLNLAGTRIDASGFVPSFNFEINQGFHPAPEISFDFVVVKRDSKDPTVNDFAQQVLAYYLYPEDTFWSRGSEEFTEDLYSDLESDFIAAVQDRNKDKARIRREVQRMREDEEALQRVREWWL